MSWCRPGNRPLSEPMVVRLPMHNQQGLRLSIFPSCISESWKYWSTLTLTLCCMITFRGRPANLRCHPMVYEIGNISPRLSLSLINCFWHWVHDLHYNPGWYLVKTMKESTHNFMNYLHDFHPTINFLLDTKNMKFGSWVLWEHFIEPKIYLHCLALISVMLGVHIAYWWDWNHIPQAITILCINCFWHWVLDLHCHPGWYHVITMKYSIHTFYELPAWYLNSNALPAAYYVHVGRTYCLLMIQNVPIHIKCMIAHAIDRYPHCTMLKAACASFIKINMFW